MKTAVVFILALVTLPIGHVAAIESVVPAEPISDPEPWVAQYDGTEIDLRFGWDSARACQTDGIETTCYDTEALMLSALGAPANGAAAPAGSSGLKRASCGSYLRLYTGTNYTGSVLALTTQYTVLNLSSYGFNNVTSSYRVGGCSSTFYDLSFAGAPVYGGATGAWAESATMLSGWDNRVSSVWIA